MKDYEKQFIEKKDIYEIDAISGATIAYNQFYEAVVEALNKAR